MRPCAPEHELMTNSRRQRRKHPWEAGFFLCTRCLLVPSLEGPGTCYCTTGSAMSHVPASPQDSNSPPPTFPRVVLVLNESQIS